MKKGKFIVIDGGEGSGKGTHLEFLKTIYKDSVFTREPGGSEYAEEIRVVMLKSNFAKYANSMTQFSLAFSARADHMEKKIIPALNSGKNVFSDRFDSSTFSYQIHAQGGENLRELFFQTRKVFLGDFAPDAYIFLNVDPKEGARRVAIRKGEVNHFDERDFSFHEKVNQGFLEFSKKLENRAFVIDANRKLEEVRADILKTIDLILKS